MKNEKSISYYQVGATDNGTEAFTSADLFCLVTRRTQARQIDWLVYDLTPSPFGFDYRFLFKGIGKS